jgi:hypothetical protein
MDQASPAIFSDNLGPFTPPSSYRFEDEFDGEPPRYIPAELKHGRYARRQRRMMCTFLFVGLLAYASSQLPIVKTWALYLLPLGYLNWIGVVSIAIALIGVFRYSSTRGPYRYVQEGVPLVARIHQLILQPTATTHGQPTMYRFFAGIEYRDPDSGNPAVARVASSEISAGAKERLTTSFRVGDYVTAVYLRPKMETTLQLYGFLDLRPDLGLVLREGATEFGIIKILVTILTVFALLGAMGWNVYALGCYGPADWVFAQLAPPFALGAILLGIPLFGAIVYAGRQSRKRRALLAEKCPEPGQVIEVGVPKKPGRVMTVFGVLLVAVGMILMGGLTGLCWSFTLNAMLDDSPPQFRPVQVQNLLVVTHKLIFREYKIEYRFLADADRKHNLLSTPDHMQQFDTDLGLAEVHAGRLGWPWVKTIVPVKKNQIRLKDKP